MYVFQIMKIALYFYKSILVGIKRAYVDWFAFAAFLYRFLSGVVALECTVLGKSPVPHT